MIFVTTFVVIIKILSAIMLLLSLFIFPGVGFVAGGLRIYELYQDTKYFYWFYVPFVALLGILYVCTVVSLFYYTMPVFDALDPHPSR